MDERRARGATAAEPRESAGTGTTSERKGILRERYDAHASIDRREGMELLSRAKTHFFDEKMRMAVALGEFAPGMHVLDAGCARGQLTISLLRYGLRMTGVDLSPRSIEVARGRTECLGLTKVDFHVGDLERLSQWSDATFDGAVSFATVRYLDDPVPAARELLRVTKPGGRVVIDFPNRWCPWFRWGKPLAKVECHPEDHLSTVRQVRRVFEAAGCEDIRLRQLLFTPMGAPDWFLPFTFGLEWFGEQVPLIRRAAGIIMGSGRRP